MEAPSDPQLTGDVTPYFYIGDSHAMVGTLLFQGPGAERIVTEQLLIRGFCARDMLDEAGRLGEGPVDVLRRISAFSSGPNFPAVEGLPVVYSTDGKERLAENLTLTRFANERPYVLCVGEINTRYIVRWLVAEGLDFDVPFSLDGLAALPPEDTTRRFRSDEMLRVFAQQFDPLFRGLRILHAAGLRSIFLHALPPPALDDAEAARTIGLIAPARLRYKVTMFVNYMYDVVCRDIGFGFINTWPLVTNGDVLNEAFYLDGLHLNRRHTILSVQEVHRQFRTIAPCVG